MSEDIIRSTKEHEVVIPEGSINAKSKSSTVGHADVEPEHVEETANPSVIIDRRVSVEEAAAPDSERVKLAPDAASTENRVRLPDEAQSENRIRLPGESIEDDRIPVISDVVQEGNTVLLPPQASTSENRVQLPIDDTERTMPALAPQEAISLSAPPLTDALEVAHDGGSEDLAQVAASFVDNRREEFAGRVVKLRGEVDQLNQRLDRLEK